MLKSFWSEAEKAYKEASAARHYARAHIMMLPVDFGKHVKFSEDWQVHMI